MPAVKDTADNSKSDIHMSVPYSQPQMLLQWLISFPTASSVNAEKKPVAKVPTPINGIK